MRAARGCAAVLLGLSLLVDYAHGTLGPSRALLWTGLALLLYAVLHPVQVAVREGELRTRGLLVRHTVRTDLLELIEDSGGLVPRLLLRDALGRHATCEPGVLTGNPLLWHRLDTDLRTARRTGVLRRGAHLLRRLEETVDRSVLDAYRLSP